MTPNEGHLPNRPRWRRSYLPDYCIGVTGRHLTTLPESRKTTVASMCARDVATPTKRLKT